MDHVSCPVRVDLSAGWPDSDPYRRQFGGAVLNAAIDLRVSARLQGSNLITSLGDVPPNSGLGTSGALRAAYLAASNPDLLADKDDLIRRVHVFENEVIGHRAGFQDQGAAIHGGVNLWEFGTDGKITRRSVEPGRWSVLEKHMVIIYTGQVHLSANIHDLVFAEDKYKKNIALLDRIKKISYQMVESIDDLHTLSALMDQTWSLQKSLHPAIETQTMRMLQKECAGKYLSCRVTGAGGGGCMIFLTENRAALIRDIRKMGFRVIDAGIDTQGIRKEC
ncbi:MAG: hypothetical protein ACOCWQ_04155 [Nanoarchaeota archaeon]